MSQAMIKPSVASMLHETQVYRASLESLYEMGKALISQPSMEATSAVAFQVLTENILEQADHQGDLIVVDGVDEPEAKVELIMQDVLTPRLTEVEAIEQALAEKEDDDLGDKFYTSHQATKISNEAYASSLELLDVHSSHIKAVREVLSMESMTVDIARPLVSSVLSHFGEYNTAIGISMESVGQTQVLGEMSDAVERIEQLVEKAHEQVVQQAETFRNEAAQVGSEDNDRLGSLIEKYREENPSGVLMDQDTKVSSITNDTTTLNETPEDDTALTDDDSTDLEGNETDLTEDESITETDQVEDNPDADETDETSDEPSELEDEGSDNTLDDTASGEAEGDFNLEEPSNTEEELSDESEPEEEPDEELDLESDENTDPEDTDLEAEVEPDEVDEESSDGSDDSTVVQLEGEDDQSEEETEESEEEGDETASTESLIEPMTFDPESYGDRAPEVRGFHTELLQWLGYRDLLSPEGRQLVENDGATDFVLSTDLMDDRAANVLVKHYSTWMNAALRDGEANMLSLSVLMDA